MSNDKYINKARFMLFGVDDELKDDSSSIYTTTINSTRFAVPAAIAPNATTAIDNVFYGVEAVNFTRRANTKRYRFSISNNFKSLKLTNKAKLVIESICVPNVISKSFLQSKAVGNVLVKLLNTPNDKIYDSSGKGKGAITIFSSPIKINTQGFGVDYDANADPDRLDMTSRARLNCDNNGILYINPEPYSLYSFPINEGWLKTGIFEIEVIYDIGNCVKNTASQDEYLLVPQTLNITTDKDDLEGFQISFIILDYEDDETIYNEKDMLNKINRLLLKKP